MLLGLADPLRSFGAVNGVFLMPCLAADVDTLLLIAIIVPRSASPSLHSRSVGFDTLVLDTSDHGAGHGTNVFLRPGPVLFSSLVFLVLHGVESSGMKHAAAF